MAEEFDLSTAKPVDDHSAPKQDGFDLSTAKPVDAGRQVALGGRAASQGVVGALSLPLTASTALRNVAPFIANHVFGGHYPYATNPADAFGTALTQAGAPTPNTAGEQLASAGISGLTGGLATGGAGAPGIANALRSGASGVTSGLSQEGARQVGLPMWAQIAAGIAAGIAGGQLPALGESTASTLGKLAAPLTKGGQQQAVGTLLNTQARNPAAALRNLQNSAPIVPGSLPTSGAASGDIGLLGVEKYARGSDAPIFGQRTSEQNLARQNELDSIAGSPSDLKAAIAARTGTTSPLYASAAQQSAPIDNEMIALMQRPSMQAAIAKAQQLAQERGQTFGMSGAGPMSLSGQDLQGVKMALDDMRSTGFTQGIGSHQARAIGETSDALKAWMQKNVPAQRQADASYATLSTPVNRMEALQDFRNRANVTAADPTTGQYFLSPSGFNRGLAALKEDPLNGLTTTDHARLGGLLKDIEQSQAINGPLLKAPGSDTFQNLSLRQNMGGLASIAGKPLDWLYNLGGADKAIHGLLTQAMLDPKFAASLMSGVKKAKPGPSWRPYATQSETSYDLGTMGGLFGATPQ